MRIDIYVSLAELSLALVGFAALVGAFSSSSNTQEIHERLALQMLVEIALTAFLLSLLAVALDGFIRDSEALWRTCSGVAAALVLAHISASIIRTRRMTLPDRFRLVLFPTVPIGLGFVVLNLLNCSSLFFEVSEGPFRAAVVAQLVFASLFFFVRFFLRETDGSAA